MKGKKGTSKVPTAYFINNDHVYASELLENKFQAIMKRKMIENPYHQGDWCTGCSNPHTCTNAHRLSDIAGDVEAPKALCLTPPPPSDQLWNKDDLQRGKHMHDLMMAKVDWIRGECLRNPAAFRSLGVMALTADSMDAKLWATRLPFDLIETVLEFTLPAQILAIGGYNDLRTVATVIVYDVRIDEWSQTPYEMDVARSEFGCVQYSKYVYVLGGTNGLGVPINLCERFDIQKRQWGYVPSMKYARGQPQVVVVKDSIYCLGSFGKQGITERLDLATNTWSEVPSLSSIHRSDYAAVSWNDSIIIISVSMGALHESVMQYQWDVKTEAWVSSLLPAVPWTAPTCYCAAVVHKDILYVVGGYQSRYVIKEAWQFDLKQKSSSASQRWTKLPAMLLPRYRLGLCVVEDVLYAIAGNYTEPHSGMTAECLPLNPTKKEEFKWRFISNLCERKVNFGIGVN